MRGVLSGLFLLLAVSSLFAAGIPSGIGDLAGAQSLLAGTDKGVYRYGDIPTDAHYLSNNDDRTLILSFSGSGTGNPRLSFNLAKPERLTIRCIDLAGRNISQLAQGYFYAGIHTVALPLFGKGRYIVAIKGNNGMAANKSVTIAN
jgi:hypothetical protein